MKLSVWLQTPFWFFLLLLTDLFLSKDLSALFYLVGIFAIPNLIGYADKLSKCWRCPICTQYIIIDKQAAHRHICYLRNKQRIFRHLQESESTNCPHCRRKLYIWPKKFGGSTFKCMSTFHNRNNILVKNKGDNRFTCFVCAFDLCLKCEVRPSAPPLIMDTVVMQSIPGENINHYGHQTMLLNEDLIVSIV